METNSLFLFCTEISKIDYSPPEIRFNVFSTNGTELNNVNSNSEIESKGSLVLRFRLATKNDVEFMEKLEKAINFEEDGSKQTKTLNKLKNVLIATR